MLVLFYDDLKLLDVDVELLVFEFQFFVHKLVLNLESFLVFMLLFFMLLVLIIRNIIIFLLLLLSVLATKKWL